MASVIDSNTTLAPPTPRENSTPTFPNTPSLPTIKVGAFAQLLALLGKNAIQKKRTPKTTFCEVSGRMPWEQGGWTS